MSEHLVQLDFQRSLLKLNKWAENYFCECLAKSAVFSKLLRTRFRPMYRLFHRRAIYRFQSFCNVFY